MSQQLHTDVLGQLNGLFDVCIIQNNLRGLYVEYLVCEILGDGWKIASGDWAAWDIEHEDGTRLEVKQSAAKQTWAAPSNGSSPPVFNIRTPKFIWEGARRFEAKGRPAQMYVFAWHGDLSECADQRDVSQWGFYVVPTKNLPKQQTIGLKRLESLTHLRSATDLGETVEQLRKREFLK